MAIATINPATGETIKTFEALSDAPKSTARFDVRRRSIPPPPKFRRLTARRSARQ